LGLTVDAPPFLALAAGCGDRHTFAKARLTIACADHHGPAEAVPVWKTLRGGLRKVGLEAIVGISRERPCAGAETRRIVVRQSQPRTLERTAVLEIQPKEQHQPKERARQGTARTLG